MGSISFHDINLVGTTSDGTLFPVDCESCGPSVASVPFGDVDSLHLRDSSVTCTKCGNQIEVESADYHFERIAFNLLFDAQITRQQARSFRRLVGKTNDLDWIIERSAQINPRLEQVARVAKKEKEPRAAFKAISFLAMFLAGSTSFLVSADDLWDKFQEGKFFEHSASQDANDVESDPQDKAEDGSEGIGNDKTDQESIKGIGI